MTHWAKKLASASVTAKRLLDHVYLKRSKRSMPVHRTSSKGAKGCSQASEQRGSEIHHRRQLSQFMAARMSSGATRRRQMEAIRKREAEADRQANRLKQQQGEALRECGAAAKRFGR